MGKRGFGFRKSIKLAPGVRLNVGKKSVGVSVGVKGLRYSANSKGGARVSASVPGTGVRYSKQVGNKPKAGKAQGNGCLSVIGLFLVIGFIGSVFFSEPNVKAATQQELVEVTFSSDPTGAALTVDGKDKGITPTTVKVVKDAPFSYTLSAPEPYEYNLFEVYSSSFTPTQAEALSIWINRTTAEQQQAQMATLELKRQQEAALQAARTVTTYSGGCGPGQTWVRPYTRRDGTSVRGHCRNR